MKGYGKMAKNGSGKVMGHEGKVKQIPTVSDQKYDMGRIEKLPMKNRGYCGEAYDYKY